MADAVSMNNIAYWRQRALFTKAKQIIDAETYERGMYQRLDSLERSFERDLAGWYTRYANNNGISPDEASKILAGINTKNFDLTLNEFKKKALAGGHAQELNNEYFKSQIARLQDLKTQLETELGSQAPIEQGKMRDGLADTLQDSYMHKLYDTQQEKAKLNTSFSRYSHDQASTIVSRPWGEDGRDFSQRIWRNYRETLPSQLADSLLRSTIKGDSYSKVINDFRARYTDVKRKHIHRLVVTEMGHVAETATAMAYEEEEVERYQYMATLESRTCPVCRRLDGKVFMFKNHLEGTNYPMIHPWCRCTTTAYFKDMPKSDARYDQDNGQLVRNMTFETWVKKVNEGSLTEYTPPKRRTKPKVATTVVNKPNPKAEPKPEPVNSDPFAQYRPTPDTSFDVKSASPVELIDYIRDNTGGMEVYNSGKTKTATFNRFALESVAEATGTLKGLLKALPDPVPAVVARGAREMGQAIAYYKSRSIDKDPIEFSINMKFYKNETTLKKYTNRFVDVKWFSNNRDSNHTMIHEYGHHINFQLNKMTGDYYGIEKNLFRKLIEDSGLDEATYMQGISRYAADSVSLNGYVEPFAELFAEAYGPTPRPQAIEFRKQFEKIALEVINNAKRT